MSSYGSSIPSSESSRITNTSGGSSSTSSVSSSTSSASSTGLNITPPKSTSSSSSDVERRSSIGVANIEPSSNIDLVDTSIVSSYNIQLRQTLPMIRAINTLMVQLPHTKKRILIIHQHTQKVEHME